MTISKKRAPAITKNISIDTSDPEIIKLDNGLMVYMCSTGTQPVIKIDLLFRAGSWYEPAPLIAASTNSILEEGAGGMDSSAIANFLDFHGAYLLTGSDRDHAFVTLYSLTKHVNKLLPLLSDIIMRPSFPENELKTYLERREQNYVVESSKVKNIARSNFLEALYGEDHPYGRNIKLSDFTYFNMDLIRQFHATNYIPNNCKIIVTGKFDVSELIKILGKHFGPLSWPAGIIQSKQKITEEPSDKRYIQIPKENALQSAVRVGRTLFNNRHPDYFGMVILNYILGGHFGSRLMQNIREKRAYTYGIGSAVISLRHSGFFVIATETATAFAKKTIDEILNELHKICTKPVSVTELELTKSQLLGEVLRGFDGPFALSDSISTVVENNLDMTYYKEFIQIIRNITPGQILELANKYTRPGDMYQVIAGSDSR